MRARLETLLPLMALEPLSEPAAASSRASASQASAQQGREHRREPALYLSVFLAKGLHLCSMNACKVYSNVLRREEERKRSHAL